MLNSSPPQFWMNGLLATELVEISHDPTRLTEPGFWAVMVTFEGKWHCARFGSVTQSGVPEESWPVIDSNWTSSQSEERYKSYVSAIRDEIALGNIYQANACRILSAKHEGSLAGLFSAIAKANPAPYMSYLNIPGWEIASASPELFLSLSHDFTLRTKPIKGTSRTAQFGEKDRAENIMIVDLMRNDLSRISVPGSVKVPHLLDIEEHPGLFHLVSEVESTLKANVGWDAIGEALLPAGSISGAPKIQALTEIAKHESERGPYCGVIGYVHNGEALLSVGIRLFWNEGKGEVKFGTGAGITWGSDPQSEWDETQLKAARLISIASGKMSS